MESLIYKARRRRISLTPLIDVVFILLMFFMVTSTFTQWHSVSIETRVADRASTGQQPQFLVLHQSGLFSLYGESTQEGQTIAALVSLVNVDKPLLLMPEAEVDVQHILNVIEQLQNNGIAQVSIGEVVPAHEG